MEDMTRDLQKQLDNEREENKRVNKRLQIVEAEVRRGGGVARLASAGASSSKSGSAEALQQEVALLKKDLETAERLAKASASDLKSKDVHLKRATESISKLKAQLADFESSSRQGERGKSDELKASEARVRALEKQKAELVDGFRKQMRLIDILKRQKVRARTVQSRTEPEQQKNRLYEFL
jgi:hypothetical protein